MKISMKSIIVITGIVAVGVCYWFLTEGQNNQVQQKVLTSGNYFAKPGEVAVSGDNINKTETYKEEIEEEKKLENQAKYIALNQNPLSLTNTAESAKKNSIDKRIEEYKSSEGLTRNYGGSSSGVGKDIYAYEEPVEVVEKVSYTPVKKSSVPTNRKIEVQKADAVAIENDNDQDLFNMVKANNNKGASDPTNVNTASIKAVVFGDHSVRPGGLIKLRLTQEATIGGQTFPRNTVLSGVANFGADRVTVNIDRIPIKNGFVPAKLSLYDQDMNEGIYVPMDEVKEAGYDQSVNSLTDVMASSLGVTPAARLGAGAAGVLRTAAGTSAMKIFIEDAYPVTLISHE